ncbi:MAG: TetR/AcrR family transcriptional regulator [Chloroflexota bacterium]
MPKQTFLNLPEGKRERFIKAAIDEFADNDYKNASISRLCKTIGIAKGSFYQYFEDKQDLVRFLIDLALHEKQALLSAIPIPDPSAGFFETLRWMFKLQAQFELKHPRLGEVSYRIFSGDLPFKDEMIEQFRSQGDDSIKGLIHKGISDGSINSEVDIETVTFMVRTLFGELSRFLQKRMGLHDKAFFTRELKESEWEEANRYFDQLITYLESGFGSKAKEQRRE